MFLIIQIIQIENLIVCDVEEGIFTRKYFHKVLFIVFMIETIACSCHALPIRMMGHF